ncbi:MAG: hypothetical protein ABI777_01735 [Betaproteobacteria bacterium]
MIPNRRRTIFIAIALAGAAFALPSVHASNVAWNVSVGGPGFAINAGQPGFRPAIRPAFVPVYRPFVRPVPLRPVGWRPYVVARPGWAPYVVVRPTPVFIAPQSVVYAPPVVFAPRFVAAPRAFVATTTFPSAAWRY